MKLVFFSILLLVLINVSEFLNQCPNVKTSLGAIRKRRYLTFPEGYDVVLTIAFLKAFMTHVPSGWYILAEIDVLFPLPDANFTSAHLRRKLHHRQKRELWERLQNALDTHNFNGKACILRSICEANDHLIPPGKSLVHDLLRAVFTAPIDEEDFKNEISDSFNDLLHPNFCDRAEECSFSILHFILNLNTLQY